MKQLFTLFSFLNKKGFKKEANLLSLIIKEAGIKDDISLILKNKFPREIDGKIKSLSKNLYKKFSNKGSKRILEDVSEVIKSVNTLDELIDFLRLDKTPLDIIKEKYPKNEKEIDIIKKENIALSDIPWILKILNNEEKIVKKGHVIIDLSLNIDENGKIKNDYEILGLIKDASINFLNQVNFKNINFNFNFQKDNYFLNEINFKAEEVNFISKKLNIKKKKNIFLVDAIVENDQSSLNSNILKLLNLSFENIIIDDAKFKTNSKFSLDIDEKFKVKNIILSSDINITQLKYKKLNIIKNYFSGVNDLILLDNHKLNLNYKDNNLLIKGQGQIQLNDDEVNEVKYLINKKDNDLSIDSELFLKNIF